MAPSTKLLVVEDLVCGPNVPCEAKLGDVSMLARTVGRNRTESEYRSLLQSGGFQVTRVAIKATSAGGLQPAGAES